MTRLPRLGGEPAVAAVTLVLSLVLGYAGGFWVAYPLMGIALVLGLAAVIRRRNAWKEAGPASTTLLVALALLAVAFAATAKGAGDVTYIGNFAMYALFAPLCMALRRAAAASSSLVVAFLALAGSLLALLIAASQVVLLGAERAAAFGSDPIWSAQAVIVVGFFSLLGLVATERPWRWVFLAGPTCAVIACILSGSRGPLLAVPVLAVLFLALGTRRWWLVLPLAAVGAVAAFGLVAVMWPAGYDRIVSLAAMAGDLIATGRIAEVSGGERQLMYQAGIAAIFDAPLFGYGWGQRLAAIAPYLPQGLDSFAQVHHHLHSDSLDFGVSAGVLGLAAYVLTLAAPVIGAWASPRDRQFRFRLLGCLGLSLAYLVFGMSYLTFGYEYHTTLYVCLAAILLGYCREPAPQAARP